MGAGMDQGKRVNVSKVLGWGTFIIGFLFVATAVCLVSMLDGTETETVRTVFVATIAALFGAGLSSLVKSFEIWSKGIEQQVTVVVECPHCKGRASCKGTNVRVIQLFPRFKK